MRIHYQLTVTLHTHSAVSENYASPSAFINITYWNNCSQLDSHCIIWLLDTELFRETERAEFWTSVVCEFGLLSLTF